MRAHSVLSVLVATALVTAGCLTTVGVPSLRQDAQQTSASEAALPVTNSTQPTTPETSQTTPTRSIQTAPTTAGGQTVPACNYTELYDRTIDSVVEIRVQTELSQTQGSGFVYNESGYIVTNQHVVADAEEVWVRFQNGTWKDATIVGTDVYTDLAVLQVSSVPNGVEALPVATERPEPGQQVVALGSPLGYDGSITHGIISGINRSMATSQGFSIPDTIQTDAPINPGNSGGPLVTMNGTVIGVNRVKKGDNLGFAISATLVRRVVPELIATGEYNHSFMGIQTVQVSPAIAEANNLSQVRGVMVVGEYEDGPAADVFELAEYERTDSGRTIPVDGDVIISVDGRAIQTQQDLARYLMLHTRPGETVTVTVLSDGDRVTETITLGDRPDPDTTQIVY